MRVAVAGQRIPNLDVLLRSRPDGQVNASLVDASPPATSGGSGSMSITTVTSIKQGVTPTSRASTIARHAIIGGALGAAAGAALSFTALPFIGVFSAPIAAAIGGAAGLVIGGIVGFVRSRGASDGAHVGAGTLQTPPPPPTPSTLPPAPPLPSS